MKILVVTGTRADYGILKPCLEELTQDSFFSVQLIVTGMHLSPLYGDTINDILNDGYKIAGTVDILLQNSTHANMAKSIGLGILGITDICVRESPDTIIVLGDRGEMLAAAIAASHLNILVVHLHGGEVSGSIDESVRHAISKISHLHFTSTQKNRERLIKMGEKEENVICIGAPRIDSIKKANLYGMNYINNEYRINLREKDYYLFIYHPVSTENKKEDIEIIKRILEYLIIREKKILIILPNSDAGSDEIRYMYKEFKHENIVTIQNFDAHSYLTILKCCKMMIGNSSSGIIEAASFNIPVINIGNRQNGRERSNNVIDIRVDLNEFIEKFDYLDSRKVRDYENIYGEGNSSELLAKYLKGYEISPNIFNKQITY